MLNILIFQSYLYGCLPFKFEKSSNRVVELKVLKVFNRFLFFFLIFCFLYELYRSSQTLLNSYQDPKVFVSVVNEIAVLFFEVSCYGFVAINLKNIENLINDIVEVSSILLKEENSLRLFSLPLIINCFVFQPLFYLYLLYMNYKYRSGSNEEIIFFLFSMLFLYPVRLFQNFFCLLLNFSSVLMDKVAEIEQISSFVQFFSEVMKVTSKVCNIFIFFARVFFFVEFFFLLTFTFYSSTTIIAWVQNKMEHEVLVFGVIVLIILTSVEVTNLILVIRECKIFKRSVSLL